MTHIIAGLHKLELAFRPQSPERLALFAQVLEQRRISAREMGDAVLACIEKLVKFPATSEILAFARPAGTNQQRKEDPQSTDAITSLERELAVHVAWLRKLDACGKTEQARWARLEAEKIQERINRRLLARGLGPRYHETSIAVEVWPPPEERVAKGPQVPSFTREFGDWTEDPEDPA